MTSEGEPIPIDGPLIPSHGPHGGPRYFVDGAEYPASSTSITGAQIKALIANFDTSYQLVLEGRGDEADRVIGDGDTLSLDKHPPLSFYTVPPATFGQ